MIRSSHSALADDAPRLLLWARAMLVAAELGLLALAAVWLDARLPWSPLLLLWLGHLALIAPLALRSAAMASAEASLHLAADAAVLGGLVYFTGGYANPSISLLLVPLILGAVALRGLQVWGLALWVGLLYTLLMHYYQPLALAVSDAAAVDLHLTGMWLNFLLTAALVAAFVGALAAALRRRDAALARAREERLRDEQLFALGLQAAAAAHDLATPLASARLTLDAMREDFSGDEELAPPLDRLSGQMARMEAVLRRLGDAARARGEEAAGPEVQAAGIWLAQVAERWGLLHPGLRILLELPEDLPELAADPALETVLMTLLNNAVEASPDSVTLVAGWGEGQLMVAVRDQGPGLGAGKTSGWGVGLELARGAVARMGGELTIEDLQQGGVQATLRVPLEAP
jgi:two-component system sensor histidine kinase RegB